jgi:hypothetical protein
VASTEVRIGGHKSVTFIARSIHQMAGVSVLETGCGQAFEQPLVDDFGNYWGHGDGAKTTHLIMKA